MNHQTERVEGILHRWLPIIAGVSLGIFLLCFTFIDNYIDEKRVKAITPGETTMARTVASDVLKVRATIDQVAHAVTTMDGSSEVQRAVDEIVAQNDLIQRLWVVDTKGNIVYFGKEPPRAHNVERLVPRSIHLFLDGLPANTLQPEQRTALLTKAAIYDPTLYGGGSFHIGEDRQSELRPVEGGLLAVVYRNLSLPGSRISPSHMIIDERFDVWHRMNKKVMGGTLILYWLSLPLWIFLDARRREEKKWVWGFFTLIGNIVSLLIYLLTRREAQLVSCPSCGRLVRREFTVCAYCGTPLKLLCPSCQHPVEMEWHYCPHCTASLRVEVTGTQTQ